MAKKPKVKPKKPDKDHEKAKELGISHRKGHVVHAGLAVKGGAGYKGRVIKITDDHTWIKIGEGKFGDRIVKAPHRLVTKEEVEMTKDILEGYNGKSGSGYKLFHKHYSGAIQHALDHHEKTDGLKTDPDEVFMKLNGSGIRKPQPGETVSHSLPATKEGKGGTEHHMIHMQIYNRDNPSTRDVQEPFELNTYSGKLPRQKKGMHEEVETIDEAKKKTLVQKQIFTKNLINKYNAIVQTDNEAKAKSVKEETEQMAALNPTKKSHHDSESSTHSSTNGRHVVHVAKNQYTGKYHGVLHSDHVYQPHHMFMSDTKDEALHKAKNLAAHAQKHEIKEDTLDELSSSTLHSYIPKAGWDKSATAQMIDPSRTAKIGKRNKGINLALDKIEGKAKVNVKEDTELRESTLVSKIINKYIT